MNDNDKTNENSTFTYSYSAPTPEQKRQAKTILSQYEVKGDEISAVEELKKLDRKARLYPQIFAYILGVVFTLVFGLGLTMILEWAQFIPVGVGVGLCAVGAILCAINYPLYSVILKRNKSKYGDKIKTLANEILKND